MDEIKRCTHLLQGRKRHGRACGEKVSKKDPEQRFCAGHRICVYVTGSKRQPLVPKPTEKYIDFETFSSSLI
uniref:Uncharacterized protein n=1 Tax=viral metagenome TaxID=1070528 RepID=A0A6C0CIF4_9ZZZZ